MKRFVIGLLGLVFLSGVIAGCSDSSKQKQEDLISYINDSGANITFEDTGEVQMNQTEVSSEPEKTKVDESEKEVQEEKVFVQEESSTTKEVKKHPFSIQVASLRDASKAKKMVSDLKEDGYDAYVSEKDLKEKGIWHRVLVGKFSTKSKAADLLPEVKEKFEDSFILKRY